MSGGYTGKLETVTSLTIWQQVKEAAVPIIVYWLLVALGLGTFCGMIFVTDGPTMENFLILGCFVIATVGGVAIGQLLAFLRVRTWLVIAAGGVCWAIFFTLTVVVASSGIESIAVFLFAILFLGPIAMTGGLWSLETNRALWSVWLPLLYLTGSILVWSDKMGEQEQWFAGNKYAIWDIVTLFALLAGVVFTLIYLVSRETHRLALWRRGPTAPLQPTVAEKGAARPRLTPLGAILLFGMAVALAGGTAILSPYLWRSGPGDREGNGGGGDPTEQQPQYNGGQGDPEESEGTSSGMSEGTKKALQKAVEAAKSAGAAICTMLTLLILVMLGVLIAYRPLKRLFVLRHLKEPFWTVPSTTRIEQGWRLVEIALGDVGVFPQPGEDAAGLARRARPVLQALSPVPVHGLEDAAEVADRVRFGLGVAPADLAVMERFSRWAIDTVWERLGDRKQVAAMYRGL